MLSTSRQQAVLVGVAAMFSNPDNWISGANARASDGTYVKSTSARAVKWCLQGGIQAVSHRLYCGQGWRSAAASVHSLVEGVVNKRGFSSIPTCNDYSGLEIVRDVLREALGNSIDFEKPVSSKQLSKDNIAGTVSEIMEKALGTAKTAETWSTMPKGSDLVQAHEIIHG